MALRSPSIDAQALSTFTRQLATLVSSGVPLLQSLEAIEKGLTGQPMAKVVQRLQASIESGLSLQSAMQQHAVFSNLYCQMVAAGELSGNLDEMLNRLASHTEKQHRLASKVRLALVYPSAVLLIALGVVAVILVWVVPVFQSIFASFGAELPWATRVILGLSEGFLKWGLPMAIALTACGVMVRQRYQSDDAMKGFVAVQVLRLPLSAPLVINANLTVWTRCMAMLVQSGVPLLDALETVASACTNRVYGLSTLHIRDAVFKGLSLSEAIRQCAVAAPAAFRTVPALFPPLLVQLIAIGEQSGSLSALLDKAADAQEALLSQRVDSLTQLIEPLMVVVLGGLVGGMVIALYLPVFQLGQVM